MNFFYGKCERKKNSALVKYVKMIDAIKSDCDDKKKTERNAKKQNAFDLNVKKKIELVKSLMKIESEWTNVYGVVSGTIWRVELSRNIGRISSYSFI